MPTRWTEDEDKYLILNHNQFDISFLSSVLERTPSAVEDRIKALQKKQIEIQPELEFFLSRAGTVHGKSPKPIKGVVENTRKLKPYTGKGSAWAHTNTGWRADLQINARSNWEANFARVLNLYGIEWEFEPEVFVYPIKRGVKGYTPDFYLNATNEWVELKGYLDSKSKTKIKRFKIYYPDQFANLTMVISRSSKANRDWCSNMGVPVVFYEEIGKLFKTKIPMWEGK